MQESPEQYQENVQYPPSAPGLTPRRFLTALRRKWWILLITATLPIGPAIWYARTRPVQYSSQASLWIRGKLQLSDVGQYREDAANFFGTQIQIIQSSQIQERALSLLKTTKPDLKEPKNSEGRTLVPVVRVRQVPKSGVFSLEAISPSAEFAQAYLDAVIDQFLAYRKEIRTSASREAFGSVAKEAEDQDRALKEEQDKLVRFYRDNNVALLEENLRAGGGQLAQLSAQLSMLKLELHLLEASAIERAASGTAHTNALATVPQLGQLSGMTSTAPTAGGDFKIAEHQLQVLKIQRDQLGRFLRPKHPKMVKLNDEVDRVERVLVFLRTQNDDQVASSREAMRLRIKSIEETTEELRKRVREANEKMSELQRINAGITRQQGFYDRFLTLLQGVDLNASVDQEEFSIMEPASPGRPPKGQDAMMVGAAAVAGLGLGLGIIFLFARSDDRCDSLIEVRDHFAEQIFGQIPDVPFEKDQDKATYPLLQPGDSRHVFAESCRNLRSSLLFGLRADERPKTILVTSATPDEGKSTVSMNLAQALAMGGSRVLLIDADLRRGHLHRSLNVKGEKGLVESVYSSGQLKQFIVPTPQPNLFLLPRGKSSDACGELFLNPNFSTLLENAAATFDYVIIDSIPVFAADDATTLAPKVDGVLFVVRRGFTSSKLAQEALESLYQRQAKILGLVFNRADSSARSYNYYKYSKYYAEAPAA